MKGGNNLSEKETFDKLATCVLTSDIDGVKAAAKQAIKDGIDPLSAIQDGLAKGLKAVGERFGDGEAFLTDLMMAAQVMSAALEILRPELVKSNRDVKSIGKVEIGTVQGDVHDIGKNLVAALLVANGFEVIDLGVDVSLEKFVEAAQTKNPDIVGLSSLMSTTMTEQKKILDALRTERLPVKILVGGAPVTEEWAKKIGADGTASDANEAAKLALSLMKTK